MNTDININMNASSNMSEELLVSAKNEIANGSGSDKPKKSFFVLAIVVLMVIIVAVGVYILFFNKKPEISEIGNCWDYGDNPFSQYVNNELLVYLESDTPEDFVNVLASKYGASVKDDDTAVILMAIHEYVFVFDEPYLWGELEALKEKIEQEEYVKSVYPNYCMNMVLD